MALKRGKGQRLIPFDDIQEGKRIEAERCDQLTADQIYERRWAFTVLEASDDATARRVSQRWECALL